VRSRTSAHRRDRRGVGAAAAARRPGGTAARVGAGTIATMLDRMPLRRRRTLSCGIVVVLASRELLLCHVTGQRQWDLPKGGIQSGETPCDAALRETHEETGLQLPPAALVDLGRHDYTASKDLHLFACLSERVDPRSLACTSWFVDRRSGRSRPEMDGYGWFAFERIAQLCTPKMAQVLTARIELDAVLTRLLAPPAPQPGPLPPDTSPAAAAG